MQIQNLPDFDKRLDEWTELARRIPGALASHLRDFIVDTVRKPSLEI